MAIGKIRKGKNNFGRKVTTLALAGLVVYSMSGQASANELQSYVLPVTSEDYKRLTEKEIAQLDLSDKARAYEEKGYSPLEVAKKLFDNNAVVDTVSNTYTDKAELFEQRIDMFIQDEKLFKEDTLLNSDVVGKLLNSTTAKEIPYFEVNMRDGFSLEAQDMIFSEFLNLSFINKDNLKEKEVETVDELVKRGYAGIYVIDGSYYLVSQNDDGVELKKAPLFGKVGISKVTDVFCSHSRRIGNGNIDYTIELMMNKELYDTVYDSNGLAKEEYRAMASVYSFETGNDIFNAKWLPYTKDSYHNNSDWLEKAYTEHSKYSMEAAIENMMEFVNSVKY